ncbi:MAG: SpoIID/LytB domain-containing protein [Deltaproteobacteria bacterium]|nr:SpoIID/LytB domain-containing protein [Deltaproteobacteria bacterium]
MNKPAQLLSLLAPLAFARMAYGEADPLAHGDRTASLYRDVLRVGEGGKPLLPLSVLSRQDKVEIAAPAGLRILGTGDGQVDVRLPPERAVELSANDRRPGVVRQFVVLARAAAWDFDTLRAQKAAWKDRGLAVRALGTGTTYGLAGRMFDTRQTLLCLDAQFEDGAVARAKAAELARQFGGELAVHTVVETPPGAELVVRDKAGSALEIHARDVLWFEALKHTGKAAALRVVGSRGSVRTDLELPGRVYVIAGQQGLEVVNEAEIERILEGVVASEIFHSAPDAALRAQAIAARTDMLAKVGTRHATDPFAICSETHCQAFRGLERVNARIAAAVHDTRGQVLVDAEGRLVDAYYHAASGGHTEANENVWPGRPQPALRGAPDVIEGGKPPFAQGMSDAAVQAMLEGKDESWAAASGLNAEACRWKTERSAGELLDQLKGFGVAAPVRELNVLRRGVSGRVVSLQVASIDGKVVSIDGELRIRDALGGSHGPKGLRSSLVIVKPGAMGKNGAPERWTFVGAGFGHGVGMDQTGAVARAKAGQDYKTILLHYYTGARLETLY